MRRKDPAGRARNVLWRGRAIKLAIVSTGLVTALATAQMAAKTEPPSMSKMIAQQQVAAGQYPTPADHSGKLMSHEEILATAVKYEAEFKRILEHAETMRVNAHRTRDLIRMTCVDERLGQMKQINAIASPRFASIKLVTEDFQMRAQFITLREGYDRLSVLADELENCTGDALAPEAVVGLGLEEHGPGVITNDTTLPADPSEVTAERPGAASPWR
jgi:hypothetical protein